MWEKRQSMVFHGRVEIFPWRHFVSYIVNLSAKPTLFTRNMLFGYTSKYWDYILHPRGEEPNPEQQKKNGSPTNNLWTMTKTVRKNTTQIQERKRKESSTNNLESGTNEFIGDKMSINAVHQKLTNICKAQVHRDEHVKESKNVKEINWQDG